MHEETLKEIVNELKGLLPGRFLGRIFQLSPLSLAIDFGLRELGFLFISIEPAAPRLYLIERTIRELEKASIPLSSFALSMRKLLGDGALQSLSKDEDERVVRFSFVTENDLGDLSYHTLLVQLTGRSANLFLLDSAGKIEQVWRKPQGKGQQLGELYEAPSQGNAPFTKHATIKPSISPDGATSFSAAADKYYRDLAGRHEFESLGQNLRAALRREISRRKKLQANLRRDLAGHGNPGEHKRLGDLLLANITTATRAGNIARVTDYYANDDSEIEIEVDENLTLAEAANTYFSRYGKAKRAIEELGNRLVQIENELKELDAKLIRLDEAIARGDATALADFEGKKKTKAAVSKKQKASLTLPGMRRYRSSDGYEVIVGRTARDNDQLTFRVARPNDLWLHAGDYPGSHVIVRNSSRNDIPHRTIIEAAQLAAKFSQASKDAKVNIHYTPRKFLIKPKGSAPGLVRMSTFKTITVAPGESLERIK
jgi:predicted ribosome quality control (RQC) complex YloA/Tae2 family protein